MKIFFITSGPGRLLYIHHVIWTLFQMRPHDRISARAALSHDYFKDLPPKIHELPDGKLLTFDLLNFNVNGTSHK